MSAPNTPIHAENATPSSVRNDTNAARKPCATSISTPPASALITAFNPTAHARRSRKPSVCAVKPAEYIDIALISSVPTRAISRYGTDSHSGSNSPMNDTGSRADASPGSESAITAPISTSGTTTTAAPATVAPTTAAPDACRGR